MSARQSAIEVSPGEIPSFFETHHGEVTAIFETLGLPNASTDSLDEAVQLTQPWVRGDHSRPDHRFDINPEQAVALTSLYDRCGLRRAYELGEKEFDHVVVFGATHVGNNNRLKFLGRTLESGKIAAKKLVLLGGERAVYPEVEDPIIQENMAQLTKAGSKDEWVKSLVSGNVSLEWETDLLRLAALVHLGKLTLKQTRIRPENGSLQALEFDLNGTPTSITHTLAVPRANGNPRHTTEACLEDWLKTAEPQAFAKIAFIGANPHIERMAKTTRLILGRLGRLDIQAVMAGPSAHNSYGHSIFLGEIARNLYEDQRMLQTS